MRHHLPLAMLGAALVATASPAGATAAPPTAEQARFFEARIRPVLAEHCLACHGADKQRGGVRLDARAGLLGKVKHGPVVTPGDPAKSVLLTAVRHTGTIKMPRDGKKLSDAAIADLAAWIAMGAPWPEPVATKTETDDEKHAHWAFRPVRKPSVPATKDRRWPRSPIDAFVLARLEAKGLQPSAAAEPRVLIRRLTFDLIGLPPTPEEIAAFETASARDAEAAVEALVDRLLASPHYGERWGRWWLDVARYADTKGYVFFEEADFPWGYTYRDYVIRALNDDVPYDRFVTEQLAADLLPPGGDRRALTALGFLTLGGRFMNNQHDIIDDRIDTVTRGLLGLTVSCARCHDHKYDPVPMADYYSLYGVFASSTEPTVPPLFAPPPTTDVYTKFAKELTAREKKLTDFVKAKHAELTTSARKRAAEYLLKAYALRDQPSTEEFMLIADGNDLNPTMVVRWQSFLARRGRRHDPVFAPWHTLAALPEKELAARAAAVLAKLAADSTKPINPLIAKALAASPPRSMTEVAQRYAAALHAAEKAWHDRGRPATMDDAAAEQLRQVFYGPDAPPDLALLPYGDLSLLPDRPSQGKLQELRKALEQWRSTGPGAPPRAMTLEDRPTPYQPYVFLRGNPNKKGPVVPRQFLAALSGPKRQPFKEGSGRLELARAIASPTNPLTARVLVNRVWLGHFGQGLVTTPSDFGLRSDPPSHPALLDWLAATFVEDGWSLKKLHRRIVLSRTYRQRSDSRPETRTADPENRLLARANRRRLDFEQMRDALLATSGRLNRTVGGPSVRDLLGAGATRRTLYAHLDRLNVPGLYRTFDFPAPDATSPQRDLTTIPPQALFLMNHPFVLGSARAAAQRPDVATEKDAVRKLDRLYRVLCGRAPSAEEQRLTRDYLAAEGNGPAAWERLAHALMQTNEFAWLD